MDPPFIFLSQVVNPLMSLVEESGGSTDNVSDFPGQAASTFYESCREHYDQDLCRNVASTIRFESNQVRSWCTACKVL